MDSIQFCGNLSQDRGSLRFPLTRRIFHCLVVVVVVAKETDRISKTRQFPRENKKALPHGRAFLFGVFLAYFCITGRTRCVTAPTPIGHEFSRSERISFQPSGGLALVRGGGEPARPGMADGPPTDGLSDRGNPLRRFRNQRFDRSPDRSVVDTLVARRLESGMPGGNRLGVGSPDPRIAPERLTIAAALMPEW